MPIDIENNAFVKLHALVQCLWLDTTSKTMINIQNIHWQQEYIGSKLQSYISKLRDQIKQIAHLQKIAIGTNVRAGTGDWTRV